MNNLLRHIYNKIVQSGTIRYILNLLKIWNIRDNILHNNEYEFWILDFEYWNLLVFQRCDCFFLCM